jgi:hypothetical protein
VSLPISKTVEELESEVATARRCLLALLSKADDLDDAAYVLELFAELSRALDAITYTAKDLASREPEAPSQPGRVLS